MQNTPKKGTLIGLLSIIMWGTAPLCTAILTQHLPIFQLLSYAFFTSTITSCVFFIIQGKNPVNIFKQPLPYWFLGLFGVFGFHLFYFLAFKDAAPIESLLIVNLWPLLMILFAVLFLHERLTKFNIIGTILAFAGVTIMVTKGQSLQIDTNQLNNYLYAFCAALIWAIYSCICKNAKNINNKTIASFCLSSGVLATILHISTEQHQVMQWQQLLLVIYLGMFPLGAAFFTWDYGMKHGDIKILGTLAYLGPLIGTLLFVITGTAELTSIIAVACVLIVGGSLVSSVKN